MNPAMSASTLLTSVIGGYDLVPNRSGFSLLLSGHALILGLAPLIPTLAHLIHHGFLRIELVDIVIL